MHFAPSLDALPAEFPVFPLAGALLLPGGQLPLNIFEPRYLAMTEDALGAGRMIGMIQPDPVVPESPNGPGLYRVGCLGRLSSFSETDDGRYLITLTGVIRFLVAEELEVRRGYRRVRADFTPFTADLAGDAATEVDRKALVRAVRAYLGRRGMNANWEAMERIPGEVLATTLCMACPFAPAEKQLLLEAPTAAERAAALLALLEMETHTSGEASGRA